MGKRGRPVGQFNLKKEAVYTFIKDQSSSGQPVLASNARVAEAIGVCERQASRYVGALVKEGRIVVKVIRIKFGESMSNIRRIEVASNVPAVSATAPAATVTAPTTFDWFGHDASESV